MKVEQVQIPERPLIDAYRHDFERVREFFPYDPNCRDSFRQRYAYLRGRRFPRQAVVEGLTVYNRQLGAAEKTMRNIQRLLDDGTAAVVTGQQAGVLTGPLYTIYKALTVLQLAERLTDEGMPTVPIFWIASEDHDFYEIAGVYFLNRDQREVEVRLTSDSERKPIGRIPVQKEAEVFLDEFAAATPDTDFKPGLMEHLRRLAAASDDLAQWFGRIMAWLLHDTGLIFFDSLDPACRVLGKDFFLDLFRNHGRITDRLKAAELRLEKAGFRPQVQVGEGQGHLFLLKDDFRYPVEEVGDDTYILRGLEGEYTAAAVSDWISGHPDTVSTNVVTRPLYQDLLFPTLAYIGGPGEIAYYAQYREVYELFGMEMPVIFPRVSITLLERTIAKGMQKHRLTPADIFFRFEQVRSRFLEEADALNLAERFGHLKGVVVPAHQRLIEDLRQLDPKFKELGSQNLQRILDEIGYLEEKAHHQHRKNSEDLLQNLDKLRINLMPSGVFQERRFNIFPYLFKYREALIQELLTLDLISTSAHYLVYL